MSRHEALEKLLTPAYDEMTISNDFEYIATKLGISIKELQGYMDAPNKTVNDYKSQQALFNLGSKLLAFFNIEKRMEKR